VIYCLQPGLHGEKFEGTKLNWRRLRVEQERVVWSSRHGHGVAGEGGEFSEQGLEAVDRQAVRCAVRGSVRSDFSNEDRHLRLSGGATHGRGGPAGRPGKILGLRRYRLARNARVSPDVARIGGF
jgi:hypothetical protein